ncbi:Glycosyl transferase family 90 [Paracoccus halophilus]|uniref:Glycosyl transferase family 90 n=1 Tax=Paracoccus halophilus TaxID=376733 RepID=A0A099EZX7_9RHOB|nr:glycosyl transferase family 90 [Paracoccus halophilus]KGJ03511.1 hypothetical protein IT41_13770 [Paracoccus halophilus]SFA57724.1 Glycosyl transferase family 90 [Paracoccus halophilus]
MAPVHRKVFQIGFNKCGTKFLTELFQMNGLPGLHWLGGRLAEDIAYSKAVGRPPLQPWIDQTVLFTDMESVHRYGAPMLEGFKEYEFLDRACPGAIFVLNTRNVYDWINSRYMHQGGEYAHFHATHVGVSLPDLAEIWYADWERHLAGCRAYFKGRPEFVDIDIDTARPEDYRDIFGQWFDLKHCPDLPDEKVIDSRAAYLPGLQKMLWADDSEHSFSADEIEQTARQMAEFARPARLHNGPEGYRAASLMVAHFDAATKTGLDRAGNRLPLAQDENGVYLTDRRADKFQRTATTISQIARHSRDGKFVIDMQDARRVGTPGKRVGHPVIAYCRRQGAENVFLWPLPGYHTIGASNFPGQRVSDSLAFADKVDRAVWRGALSGNCSDVVAGHFHDAVEGPISVIAGTPPDSPESRAAQDLLSRNIRFAFVETHAGAADIDAALTPDEQTRAALERIGKTHLTDSFRRPAFFHRYRYMISLRGNDTGSNFLLGANSNSVVLKEEDGWELFYSFLFRPWQHYIPLAPGAGDILDKLDWARRNPEKCQAMSQDARRQCLKLADRNIRNRYLELTVAAYQESCREHAPKARPEPERP